MAIQVHPSYFLINFIDQYVPIVWPLRTLVDIVKQTVKHWNWVCGGIRVGNVGGAGLPYASGDVYLRIIFVMKKYFQQIRRKKLKHKGGTARKLSKHFYLLKGSMVVIVMTITQLNKVFGTHI